MSVATNHPHLLRARGAHGHTPVTNIELFFDLVFVFAVTQLSHMLLKDLTLLGAVHTALLFVAVWWVWIFTSWVTNWLEPERVPVRLLLLALMFVGLVLSTSIPQAFGARALPFALAYVSMQVGRSLFMLWALRHASAQSRRNFLRITVWLSGTALFWIAGAWAEGGARLALWGIAIAIELASPALGFWLPGHGRSTTSDWDVDGGHMAERCALFIIIALGESLLIIGATLGDLPWTPAPLAAFVVAFIGSAAMWWIYFDTGAARGSRRIAASKDPGRLARLAYTYLHLPIVAGIIVAAVGDELVLAHPIGHTEAGTVATLLGGPSLFLLGTLLFKSSFTGRPPLSHLIGLGLLALLVPVASHLQPLALSAATSAVMILVAVWETISLRAKPSRT